MGKFDGQIALVTGASKGIGTGIAFSLAKQGAAVAVNYLCDRQGADRVVEKHNLVYRSDYRIVPAATANSGTPLANGAKTL